MDETAIIVPARLGSTRFPRKLLHEVLGKPLLLHVADRIAAEAPEYPLYFAVDSDELAGVLSERGYEHVMTSPEHPSGSDRIAEANDRIRAEFVVNVQADEPLVTGEQIRWLAHAVRGGAPMATLATRFRRAVDFYDPNQVKVVLDERERAVYFSRAPIPYSSEAGGKVDDAYLSENAFYRHLGLYAYHADFLKTFTRLSPGKLEGMERLEQLRALENGYSISVGITTGAGIGIDAPEDAARYEACLAGETAG